MNRGLFALIAVALMAGLLGAWGPDADDRPRHSKAKRCTHGKVLVKVKRRASCKRLASVLPRPKRGDVRLAYVRAALNFDASKLKRKHRHGKRPRSLQRGFGRTGKKARKKFLRVLPRALKRIDRRLAARAGVARTGCGGPGSAEPVPGAGSTDGVSLQALVGPHGEEGGVMKYTLDGMTFEVTFIKCGRGLYYAPSCPRANGDADTSSRGNIEVSIRVRDKSKLVSSETVSSNYKDTLHGKVAADARLDYLDFKRVEDSLIIATGGVAERGEATRLARVNMRTGKYDAAHSRVTISGDPGAVKGKDFAQAIQSAIDEYRAAEVGGSFLHTDGWSTLDRKGSGGYCASAVFAPASGTLKLAKDATGQVSMYAKANDGGKAAAARWTLLGQSNATFSPGSSAAREPSLGYRVTAAPPGGRVEMSLKFTSTAGVGKAVWSQPTSSDIPLFTGHVTGSGSEEYVDPDTEAGCDYSSQWSYQSDLSGDESDHVPFRLHPSIPGGDEDFTAWGYNITASGSGERAACHETPACTATVGRDGIGDVQFGVRGSAVHVTAWTAEWQQTGGDCEGAVGFGGSSKIGEADFPLSALDAGDLSVPLSFDFSDSDTTIHGSGTLTLHRVN